MRDVAYDRPAGIQTEDHVINISQTPRALAPRFCSLDPLGLALSHDRPLELRNATQHAKHTRSERKAVLEKLHVFAECVVVFVYALRVGWGP